MATGSVLMMLAIFAIIIHLALDPVVGIEDQSSSNVQISGTARKLLRNSTYNSSREALPCDSNMINVHTGPVLFPLFYTVEVLNVCEQLDCKIGNIHLSCLFFFLPVEPPLLTMTAPGDCLFNDGKPLDSNVMISFSYTSTFAYPFTLLSATCL